ncbi:uncharacterized protein BXZ73DRAFT_107582 [Epithele typhae]|uniref:uncharacterized protein n=1 Tax=Epithele typhae TaxID=378194 RepID=UPI00200800BA|nr:uncharacterized protein BXZ73DRAFT_107582 [Epithele typhae]KAH9912138.1 hypothetical protein BXZ73DRAFT_107582 [Epithele typhae]
MPSVTPSFVVPSQPGGSHTHVLKEPLTDPARGNGFSQALTEADLPDGTTRLTIEDDIKLPIEIFHEVFRNCWMSHLSAAARLELYKSLRSTSRATASIAATVAFQHPVVHWWSLPGNPTAALWNLIAADTARSNSPTSPSPGRPTANHLLVDLSGISVIFTPRASAWKAGLPDTISLSELRSATFAFGFEPGRTTLGPIYHIRLASVSSGLPALTHLFLDTSADRSGRAYTVRFPGASFPALTFLRLHVASPCRCAAGDPGTAHQEHCILVGLGEACPRLRHLQLETPIPLSEAKLPPTVARLTLAAALGSRQDGARASTFVGYTLVAAVRRGVLRGPKTEGTRRVVEILSRTEELMGFEGARDACAPFGVVVERRAY